MTAPIRTTSISDNISGANQTNLILKGIIAIGAMAKISGCVGNADDQSYYQVCNVWVDAGMFLDKAATEYLSELCRAVEESRSYDKFYFLDLRFRRFGRHLQPVRR